MLRLGVAQTQISRICRGISGGTDSTRELYGNVLFEVFEPSLQTEPLRWSAPTLNLCGRIRLARAREGACEPKPDLDSIK